MSSRGEVCLEIKGVVKDYPGVRALDHVDFSVGKEEVHVLVGENGAGKSTLVKVISGATIPDEIVDMKFDGKLIKIEGPRDSLEAGIAVIYQHFSLVPHLTVAANIFLGQEKLKGIFLDHQAMQKEAKNLIDDLGVDIDPRVRVDELSAGDQQVVEICKAISRDPKLLIMDEPTSGLKSQEIARLFKIIKGLKERGLSILYISHRLEEIFEIGDAITVLRNGEKVHEGDLEGLDHASLTRLIIGRELDEKFPKEENPLGEVIFKADKLENLKSKVLLKDISFEAREGEILGIYGILGSGKDELAHTLFGLLPATGGEITVNGKVRNIVSAKDAIANNMGYLTDDRHRDGLVEVLSVKNNLTMAALRRFHRIFLRNSLQVAEASEYVEKLRISTPSLEALVKNLSGGNQQKVVLGKWLIAQASILLLNEPTKGIDVGAKVEVFRLMMEQVRQKKAVIFLTSELEEVMGMADRIIVMRNGQFVEEYSRSQIVSGEIAKDQILMVATKKEKQELVS